VFPVELPPLRKRKEDIPLLAEHFLRLSARKVGRATPRLTLAAVQRLQQYDWPGIVRELQHVLERAVITSTGGRINVELPSSPNATRVAEAVAPEGDRVRTDAEIRQLEADNIRAALKTASGKVSGPGGAAQLLGVKPTTLASRIKSLGIVPPSAPDGECVSTQARSSRCLSASARSTLRRRGSSWLR
jgi:transcriptional regulator with GAF, ATPase, and Fis domain